MTEYPSFDENLKELLTFCDPDTAFLAASEIAYFHEHGVLPVDAVVIEHVIEESGSWIYVHRDTRSQA